MVEAGARAATSAGQPEAIPQVRADYWPVLLVPILALAALAYGSFWLLGGPALEWSRARDGAEPFGRLAAAGTPDDREILAWDAFPDPFVYYAGRPIRELTEVEDVLDRLRVSPEGLVILAKTKASAVNSPCGVATARARPASRRTDCTGQPSRTATPRAASTRCHDAISRSGRRCASRS